MLLVANVVLFIMSAYNIYKTMDGAQKLDADGEHKGKNRSAARDACTLGEPGR